MLIALCLLLEATCHRKNDSKENGTDAKGRDGAIRELRYEGLIAQLQAIGVDESYKGIAAKINRGTFSFAFFMQCMKSLKQKTVRLEE